MAINGALFKTTTALEDFSLKAMNESTDYIADEIFSPIVVGKEAVKVYQYDSSQFRVTDSRKASSAEADSVDFGVFATNRTCLLHKLRGEYDPADVEQFDTVVANLEQDVAATIMDRLMLYKETEAATAVTTTGNYPSALTATLGATETWIVAGGDPFGTSSTARAAVKTSCSKAPNAAAMSWTTFEKLRGSSIFLDVLKYTKASATEGEFETLLKNWLGVQALHIGKALKNTNIESAASQALTDVWGDGVLFYVKNTSVSPRVMRYGANYTFNQLYTYKSEDTKRGSGKGRIQLLEMGMSYVLAAGAVVSSTDTDFSAGYYLANVV
jgi:hypothetical protein